MSVTADAEIGTSPTPEQAAPSRSGAGSRLVSWFRRQQRNLMIGLLVGLFGLVYFLPSIVYFIPAGHGGVLWKRFHGGTQMLPALPEGINLTYPWDRIEIYDLRLKEDSRSYESIANDGLVVTTDITIRYRLIGDYLGTLHQTVGSEYLTSLIVPEVGSVVREIISRYKADELYAQRRQKIQEEIYDQLVDRLMYRGVIGARAPQQTASVAGTDEALRGYVFVQDVLIRNVVLPEALVTSIERKVQQDQFAQEYEFRLQREAFESQRKQVEAQGIKSFQDTVNTGITENYLRWRGIEATLELARSPNAKVVVIGSGQNGLPLILNTGNEAGAALDAAAPQQPVDGHPPANTPPSAPAARADLPGKTAEPSRPAELAETAGRRSDAGAKPGAAGYQGGEQAGRSEQPGKGDQPSGGDRRQAAEKTVEKSK
ncbi:prohibitin family protein [Arenibaculum pallidiluteum]|uniref:prohibitin family protein n=1 Tax=Arenibaculum pallidiluteum TaxID=2812559 RepID=UPI001A95CCED|nr:prohibitin family protein [Arenibaculum pallidiluteum]